MAAPVSVSHTHVCSIRLQSGREALVARVLAADGQSGFGFTLNDDAGVARDMAAWDAAARARGQPLHALLGAEPARPIAVQRDEAPAIAADWTALRRGLRDQRWKLLRLDPFAWGSLEIIHSVAAASGGRPIALLAPHAHPWEIAWCAALAATLSGARVHLIVRGDAPAAEVCAPDQPGIGVDWSLEPAFAGITWQTGQPSARPSREA
jgi:L-alanine-DL-glutamate epimerase-like enolase superfamily enzyme